MLNRMKKLFAALLALAMLAGCTPVFADEVLASYAYCSHWWTVGDTIYEPSCKSTGLALQVCAWCSAISNTPAVLPMTAHNYSVVSQVLSAASCTEGGMVIYACSGCGETEHRTSYIPALGHNYGSPALSQATCTNNEEYGRSCSRCGDKIISWIKPGTALGHDIRETVLKEASCTSKGAVQIKCSRCDEIEAVTREIPMLPHSYKSYNSAPSCTEPGIYGTVCTICGAESGTVVRLPALGHKLLTIPGLEPTCETAGYSESASCTVCLQVIKPQTVIPALGHELMVLPPKAPSCTESGLSIGEYCANCKEVFQPQFTVPALGHTTVIDAAKPADCANEGLTEGSHCGVCGVILVPQKTVPTTTHDWALSKNGKLYVCENCGEELSAKPSAVSIDAPLNLELSVGDTLSLDVIYSPRDSYSPVSWSSSSKKVVSVDEYGSIEALKEGNATITVKTANGKKDTLKIKVIDPFKPSKVELDRSGTIILGVGEELQLNAALYPATAVTTLDWDCSSSRCTVDEDGFVTAIRTGTATITVETANGKKDSVSIRVVKADEPYSVTLSESGTIYLAAGEELQLEAEVLPATADTELKWSSSSSRCTVDADGCITGVRTGTATITVKTANGKKDTVKVRVY